jgi:crossover junction endodeoxyribonuclease RuvC
MNDGLMAELLLPYREQPRVFCVLEEIFSKPLESNKSALTIGRHWGLWKGILTALSIPHEVAPGSVWKRGFRLLSGEKEMSRARAMELFPAYRAILAKKRVDFSEALLLAEYARRRQTGAHV